MLPSRSGLSWKRNSNLNETFIWLSHRKNEIKSLKCGEHLNTILFFFLFLRDSDTFVTDQSLQREAAGESRKHHLSPVFCQSERKRRMRNVRHLLRLRAHGTSSDVTPIHSICNSVVTQQSDPMHLELVSGSVSLLTQKHRSPLLFLYRTSNQ